MEQLFVPYIKHTTSEESIDYLSLLLDGLDKHVIQSVPWASYPYKPKVEFCIAHNNQNIFLKYYVTEKYIRSVIVNTNGPVWKDSCVEIFISFDEKGYYNLEFNCIGTARVGFGKIRNDRVLIPEEDIKGIRVQSHMKRMDNFFYWELIMSIPLQLFIHHQLASLSGKECRVNFYKCGDELPEPHFLAWSDIVSKEPDFHLPDYFGRALFE